MITSIKTTIGGVKNQRNFQKKELKIKKSKIKEVKQVRLSLHFIHTIFFLNVTLVLLIGFIGLTSIECANQLYSNTEDRLPDAEYLKDQSSNLWQSRYKKEFYSYQAPRSDPFDLAVMDEEDDFLHYELMRIIRDENLTSLMETKSIGICVVNLKRSHSYAGINMDDTFYGASFPKVLILLGAIQRAYEDPDFSLDRVSNELEQMIRRSSNTAATSAGRKVGIEFIKNTAAQYRLYDFNRKGGLWLGRFYANASEWIGNDPLTKQHTHAATARQAARFWLLAHQNRYIDEQWSKKLLAFTANSLINHKIVRGLSEAQVNAKIWRKSGTYNPWHVDAGIVKTEHVHYIVAILVKNSNGELIIRNLIKPIHALMKANTIS